jgi:adenylate kinase family enzyme
VGDARSSASAGRLIWVAGLAGAGKSTVCQALRNLGVAAIDTDWDGYNHWVERSTSLPAVDPPYPTPPDWVDDHAWNIRPERVRALRDGTSGITFLFGMVENEAEVWNLFDRVGCLVIDDQTIRHRLASRTTNAFGKHPEDLERVLEWNRSVAASYRSRGAVIIDGTRPLEDVVEAVLGLQDGM